MTQEFYLLSIIPNQQTRLKLQTLRQRLFQAHGLASALAFEPVIPLAWFEAPVDSGGYAHFSTGMGNSEGSQLPGAPWIEFGTPKLWAGHLYIGVVVQPEKLFRELINAAGQPPVPASIVSPSPETDDPSAESGFPSIPEAGAPPIPAAEGIILAANETERAKAEDSAPAHGSRSVKGAGTEAEHRGRAELLQTTAQQIAQLTPHLSDGRILESTRIGMYSMRFSSDSRRWWEHVEWTLEWKIQLKRAE